MKTIQFSRISLKGIVLSDIFNTLGVIVATFFNYEHVFIEKNVQEGRCRREMSNGVISNLSCHGTKLGNKCLWLLTSARCL